MKSLNASSLCHIAGFQFIMAFVFPYFLLQGAFLPYQLCHRVHSLFAYALNA